MNYIPKTQYHFSDSYVIEEEDFPFCIDQDRNIHGIWNHIIFNMGEVDEEARKETVAIFRVYRKGQNPLSKQRQSLKVINQY